MNSRVAYRTVLCADARLRVRSRRDVRIQFNIKDVGVAFQAKLPYGAALQHFRIIRAMRRVACIAPFGLQRSMFISERPLHLGVAFHTCLCGAKCKPSLFLLKAAVRIMAVAAVHRSFKHLVVEGLRELCFHFGVAANAKLRLTVLKHCAGRKVRPLCCRLADKCNRAGLLVAKARAMGRVAVSTTYVVTPVVAPSEIIMVFFSCVAGKA